MKGLTTFLLTIETKPHRTWRNNMPSPEKGNRRLSKCRHFSISRGIIIRHLKGIIQYLLFWRVLFLACCVYWYQEFS